MPKAITTYVRWVDGVNRFLGRFTMHLIFLMMGVLLYAAISRSLFNAPVIWAVEMAQFILATYYMLGGAYSLQLGAHVRMDLIFGRWSPRKRAFADSLTAFFLIFYLIFLLFGGVSSTQYALEYGQRNYSVWAPPMAPIKIIMCAGILMMLCQAVAMFFKDLASFRGEPIT